MVVPGDTVESVNGVTDLQGMLMQIQEPERTNPRASAQHREGHTTTTTLYGGWRGGSPNAIAYYYLLLTTYYLLLTTYYLLLTMIFYDSQGERFDAQAWRPVAPDTFLLLCFSMIFYVFCLNFYDFL